MRHHSINKNMNNKIPFDFFEKVYKSANVNLLLIKQ